ncbi:ankyrin repeat domain-containing protein [Hahella ganghwensis]|uniref:ankyrin repeat domain-containing protein n=1 Tax=Hahella ganghwensis TaxID=286420 RepID=UPI00035EA94A|nr:ankyrin repeat domain-containing protein [Hahella ganghwensis]
MNPDREEILEKLEEIEFWPDLKKQLENYLACAIGQKDIESIKALLKAGANPNPIDDLDDHLHHLLHEYQVEKTTKGELILSIVEALLKYGANPNRVWSNNLRAYDYAVSWNVGAIVELLENYGADKELRKPVKRLTK